MCNLQVHNSCLPVKNTLLVKPKRHRKSKLCSISSKDHYSVLMVHKTDELPSHHLFRKKTKNIW